MMPAPEAVREPEDWSELLAERAQKLARPLEAPVAGAAINAVSFLLANETYAIDTSFVVSAFRLATLVALPGARPPVFGLTVWRGDLLTIADLRPPLGLSVSALNDLSRVLVLGAERAAFGIVVDEIRDLATIRESDIVPLPDGMRRNRRFVRGMTRDATLVLDGAPLLHLLKPAVDHRLTQ